MSPEHPSVVEGRERRAAIIAVIETFMDQYGFAPTRKQIGEQVGVGETAASKHVTQLIKDGVLEQPYGPKSLRVARRG